MGRHFWAPVRPPTHPRLLNSTRGRSRPARFRRTRRQRRQRRHLPLLLLLLHSLSLPPAALLPLSPCFEDHCLPLSPIHTLHFTLSKLSPTEPFCLRPLSLPLSRLSPLSPTVGDSRCRSCGGDRDRHLDRAAVVHLWSTARVWGSGRRRSTRIIDIMSASAAAACTAGILAKITSFNATVV